MLLRGLFIRSLNLLELILLFILILPIIAINIRAYSLAQSLIKQMHFQKILSTEPYQRQE